MGDILARHRDLQTYLTTGITISFADAVIVATQSNLKPVISRVILSDAAAQTVVVSYGTTPTQAGVKVNCLAGDTQDLNELDWDGASPGDSIRLSVNESVETTSADVQVDYYMIRERIDKAST